MTTAKNNSPNSPATGSVRRSDEVVDDDSVDYRKAFLKTRLVVGVIGVLLAPVVVLGDHWIFHQPWRPTLSHYYYSSMRNWLVGSLWAIGSGLLIYLARYKNRGDSFISFTAGLLAIGVAMFPTSEKFGLPHSAVPLIHVVCASTLLVLLGIMSLRFGRRDRIRPGRTELWQRTWQVIHKGCGCVILGASVTSLILGATMSGGIVILLGETIAVTVFGLSWFLKGSELFNLLREEQLKPPILRKSSGAAG